MNGMEQVGEWTQTAANYGLRLLGAILVVLVAWRVARIARDAVKLALERAQAEPTLTRFGGNLAYWSIIGVALLAALGTVGIETTNVATVLGGASVAMGLAFKDSLGNFAAGILLMMFRPFRAGDTITVAGVTGRVYDIELFVTRLDTADHRRLMLPNSVVFRATIENATHHPTRRVDVVVAVPPTAESVQVRRLLTDIGRTRTPKGMPAAEVVLQQIGARTEWSLQVWCPTEQAASLRELLLEEVQRRFLASEIPLL